MKNDVLTIIKSVFEEINETRKEPIDISNINNIVLYGSDGVFESMQLVSFLAAVEEGLEDELDMEISLTSEKAVSRTNSPFSSVNNLVNFILEESDCLQEAV